MHFTTFKQNIFFDWEPLPLMKFLAMLSRRIGRYKVPYFRYLGFIFGIVYLFCQITCYTFFPHNDIKYIFNLTISFYLVVAVICQTFIMNIEKLMVVQQEFYLPLDFGGPRIKKTIIKAIQYEEIRCLITTLLIIVVIPCKINPNTLSERDHVAAILQKFCPKYEIIYLLIHTLFYLLSMPSVLAWHLVFMYFNWHVQFQVRTLIAHVENLCGYAGSLNYDECIADQLYQAYVRKQLKIVLKRHSEVIRYHRLTMQHLKVSITSLLLGLFGSFVCFMGFWIIRVYHTMDSISIVLAFLFAVDSLGYSAQEYQDQFLTVYDYALKVPWYQWDISNRKAYLLLIHKSSLMIPYPFFNTCVNRQFELELLKTIYSLGSIFINI